MQHRDHALRATPLHSELSWNTCLVAVAGHTHGMQFNANIGYCGILPKGVYNLSIVPSLPGETIGS